MNLPDGKRDEPRERMWHIADAINWLALGPSEKTQHYENWTKDPDIGGVLQRYMALGQVRVYIKDSLLKDYPSSRRADQGKPFRMIGLDDRTGIARVFTKPHGRMLVDGRIVCWGRAADWKTVLLAAFERSLMITDAIPFAVVLSESSGRFSEISMRSVVVEAAKRLGIVRLLWES